MSATAAGTFDAVLRDVLTSGMTVRFRAAGTSMYPTIRDGDTIVVAPVEVADVTRGDVILFRSSGRLLAHRVVDVTASPASRTLRMRGDAKRGCDTPVSASDVIGRVTSVERGCRAFRLHGRIPRLRHRVRAALSFTRHRLLRPRIARETC